MSKLCAGKITYWINLQILCFWNKDFNKFHSVTGECGNVNLVTFHFLGFFHWTVSNVFFCAVFIAWQWKRRIVGCNLIGGHFCFRSHYIARQTFATVEWKSQTFIHCKFLASSSVSRWKFCWCFWVEQLKGICKQRHCSVNSTRSTDESNQSKQHRYKNLSWGTHVFTRFKRSRWCTFLSPL